MTKPTNDHKFPHPLAKTRVRFLGANDALVRHGDILTVVDWFDRVTQTDWRETFGDDYKSPATLYAKRRGRHPGIPKDNKVVMAYDKYGRQIAVHEQEIGAVDGQEE